jgi:hypothetical protein
VNVSDHIRQFVSASCERDARMPLKAEAGFMQRADSSEIVLGVRAEKSGRYSLSADVIQECAVRRLSASDVVVLISRKVQAASLEHKAYWYSRVWC